jgi:hypothetical protein
MASMSLNQVATGGHEQYLGSEVFEVEPGRNRHCNVLVIPAREDEKS